MALVGLILIRSLKQGSSDDLSKHPILSDTCFCLFFSFCFVLSRFLIFVCSNLPAAGLSPGPCCFPKENLDAVLVNPVGEGNNALDGFIRKQEQQHSRPIHPEL